MMTLTRGVTGLTSDSPGWVARRYRPGPRSGVMRCILHEVDAHRTVVVGPIGDLCDEPRLVTAKVAPELPKPDMFRVGWLVELCEVGGEGAIYEDGIGMHALKRGVE